MTCLYITVWKFILQIKQRWMWKIKITMVFHCIDLLKLNKGNFDNVNSFQVQQNLFRWMIEYFRFRGCRAFQCFYLLFYITEASTFMHMLFSQWLGRCNVLNKSQKDKCIAKLFKYIWKRHFNTPFRNLVRWEEQSRTGWTKLSQINF